MSGRDAPSAIQWAISESSGDSESRMIVFIIVPLPYKGKADMRFFDAKIGVSCGRNMGWSYSGFVGMNWR